METALSIAAITIAVISAAAAGVACYYVRMEIRMMRYTYLANKWYEIKEKEFINPDFTDPSKTSTYKTSFTGNVLRKYETFTWICWGHAEDVFRNKWHKDPGFQSSLKWCKSLHYSWLNEPDNKKYFSSDFLRYVDELK